MNNSNEKILGLGDIETVNNISTIEQQSFSFDKPVLIITGWSLDQNNQQLDNLYLLVDEKPFLKYDDFISRTDIVNNHDTDSSELSGWIISFLSGYLEEGCHNLSVASLKNQQIIMFEQVIQICKN